MNAQMDLETLTHTRNQLLDKYKDKITIKVHHYIQGNINSGIIGHRSDCLDYEDIEEVGKDKDGNIELSICVMD